MLNEAIIRLDLLNCMLNEGNIRSLATVIQEEFFKSVNKNSYNDLSQDEKEKLSNYIKTRSEEIKKLVSEISSDTNEQAFVYDILMNHEQTFPEDFNDVKTAIQEFSKIKKSENFKGEKDINKYKSFSDLHKAVYDFKQEFNKREFVVSFNIGEKILSFDSFDIYKLEDKDFEEFSKFAKDNNVAWCVKEKKYWDSYGAPYYYIEKSNKPFALLHYESNQFKNVHDKELKQTDELIKLLVEFYKKTGVLYKRWNTLIYKTAYPNAAPTDMFIALNKHSKLENGVICTTQNVSTLGDYIKDGKLVIKFGTVSGYFDCSGSKLISLEGCPKKVGRNFQCDANRLTSLKGAPTEVGGDFVCGANLLTSMEYCPSRVGGSFDCSYNDLISLEGCPNEIYYYFICSNNHLTTLKGSPSKVGGTFICESNNLISMEGCPKEVGGNFKCESNDVKFTEEQIRSICKVDGYIRT